MHHEVLPDANKKLFPTLSIFGDFYLAGGTAIALQIGHRISVDFDLFTDKEISRSLIRDVERVFAESTIQPLVHNSGELTLVVDGIKLTFLQYPFPLARGLVELEGIKMLSIAELAATKAYTVGRRGVYRDYIDIYFCLQEKDVSLEGIITDAERKFGDTFNGRLFLEQLVYMEAVEDAEESKLILLKEQVDRQGLISFFGAEIKKML
ncbi:MAG: nucleotidyl transferase AbiEii/AbiGii toxin family protein [bacterium]|nr:nucleotidyl transferase AbiEii/AbiGii toxin family protein [bacterium]